MRAYKTVNDSYIEPISFTVPRRAETFQSDIYPPATGLKPAVSAKQWLDGKSGLPAKLDLESIYEGSAPVEVPADYKPPQQTISSPPPSAKILPKKEPEPAKPVARGPPPNVSDQKASISAMANKYQEMEDEGSDEDDVSSFEEVSRPATKTTTAYAAKPASPVKAKQPPVVFKSPPPQQTPAPAPAASAAPTASSSGPGIEASLTEIKQLLASQSMIISTQIEKIAQLTQEMEVLKRKVGAGTGDQSERIRQLELELEAARS